MKIIFLLIVNIAYGASIELSSHFYEKNGEVVSITFNSEEIVLLPINSSRLEWRNFYAEQAQ